MELIILQYSVMLNDKEKKIKLKINNINEKTSSVNEDNFF